MSAPPVPTSSTVRSVRCAASASMAPSVSATPPSQRFVRREVAEVAGERGRIVERAVQQLVDAGDALHRERLHRSDWLDPSPRTLWRDAPATDAGPCRSRRPSPPSLLSAVVAGAAAYTRPLPDPEPRRPRCRRARHPGPADGARRADRASTACSRRPRRRRRAVPGRARPDRRRGRRRRDLGAARRPAGHARAPVRPWSALQTELRAKRALEGRRRRRLSVRSTRSAVRAPPDALRAAASPGVVDADDLALPHLATSSSPRSTSAGLCDYSVGQRHGELGRPPSAIAYIEPRRAAQRRGRARAGVALGDIGLEHGGNIAGHDTHSRGLDVDVRLIRKDRRAVPRRDDLPAGSSYDRSATRALIQAIRDVAPGHVKLIYFNDPVLIKEGLTRRFTGHDDHLHVRFCEKRHVDPRLPLLTPRRRESVPGAARRRSRASVVEDVIPIPPRAAKPSITRRGASASRPIAERASPVTAEDARRPAGPPASRRGRSTWRAAGEHLHGQPCPGRVQRRAAQVDLAAAVPEQRGAAAEGVRRCSRT